MPVGQMQGRNQRPTELGRGFLEFVFKLLSQLNVAPGSRCFHLRCQPLNQALGPNDEFSDTLLGITAPVDPHIIDQTKPECAGLVAAAFANIEPTGVNESR
jgi:hypothetical protein